MASAVRVRGDYEAAQLRALAKRSADAAQTRRLLALAAIYDGGSRTEAARLGGVGLQTVRDWVLAFNAVLCLLLAIVCSLAPILLAVRTDLQSVMRGGHAAARPRGS